MPPPDFFAAGVSGLAAVRAGGFGSFGFGGAGSRWDFGAGGSVVFSVTVTGRHVGRRTHARRRDALGHGGTAAGGRGRFWYRLAGP